MSNEVIIEIIIYCEKLQNLLAVSFDEVISLASEVFIDHFTDECHFCYFTDASLCNKPVAYIDAFPEIDTFPQLVTVDLEPHAAGSVCRFCRSLLYTRC